MIDIVVTGVGIVTPIGSKREISWENLIAGRSGIARLGKNLEARVVDFSPNGARSRMGDFALLAAEEALEQAGLDDAEIKKRRIGCAMSQSKPIVSSFPRRRESRETSGSPITTFGDDGLIDPSLLMSSFFGWSSEVLVQREFNLSGPTANISAACATGIASIRMGLSWLLAGVCDAALVGASESSLNDLYRSGFDRLGVLSDEGAKPFDRDRTGFVMGEGAAALVLEKREAAEARGARILARLEAAELQQSLVDSLRFDSDGSVVARLIDQAIRKREKPSYINAHGTGTVLNDVAETRGIRKALGARASSVAVSSTKAATGHLLGAAGAVEAAFAVLAVRDQVAPPTLNLTASDPECDLDYVPRTARRMDISSAMSLSYGFGGQMGAVVFSRV